MSEKDDNHEEKQESQPEKQESPPEIYDKIGEICKENNVESALFLARDPETNELLIWYKGSQLDSARMSAYFTKLVKTRIMEELTP